MENLEGQPNPREIEKKIDEKIVEAKMSTAKKLAALNTQILGEIAKEEVQQQVHVSSDEPEERTETQPQEPSTESLDTYYEQQLKQYNQGESNDSVNDEGIELSDRGLDTTAKLERERKKNQKLLDAIKRLQAERYVKDEEPEQELSETEEPKRKSKYDDVYAEVISLRREQENAFVDEELRKLIPSNRHGQELIKRIFDSKFRKDKMSRDEIKDALSDANLLAHKGLVQETLQKRVKAQEAKSIANSMAGASGSSAGVKDGPERYLKTTHDEAGIKDALERFKQNYYGKHNR